MGKAFERTIRIESDDNKAVRSLEYNPETRMVRIQIDGKPELPSVAFLPIEQVSYIAPLPKEGEVKPAIVAPVPVYVPPPPPAPVVKVTAEQAAEIRRQYKINHPGPQPAQWEKDASAYAEQEQKRHMGLSEKEPLAPGYPTPAERVAVDEAVAAKSMEHIVTALPCGECSSFINKDDAKNILRTGICDRTGQEVSKTDLIPDTGCPVVRTDWRSVGRTETITDSELQDIKNETTARKDRVVKAGGKYGKKAKRKASKRG